MLLGCVAISTLVTNTLPLLTLKSQCSVALLVFSKQSTLLFTRMEIKLIIKTIENLINVKRKSIFILVSFNKYGYGVVRNEKQNNHRVALRQKWAF